MSIRIRTLFVLLLVMLSACQGRQVTSTPTPYILVTVAADATPTCTPFQPQGAQPAAPVPGDAPPAAAPIRQPAGQTAILLLGSDQRPEHSDFRTDVMMLAAIRADGSVSLVSFPRDLYVYIPAVGMDRLNTAMEYGGFDQMKATLEYNFGFSPQSYVLTNFGGFKSIVDSLGGVNVNVGQTFEDARDGYPDGFTVNPGIVHMDGETALWYVRSRQSTSDFDRLRRAQEMVVAIAKRLFSLNALARVPELYAAFRDTVTTDLTLDDMLQLLPLFQTIDDNRVTRYVIDENQATSWIEPDSGRYYLIPDPAAIRAVLQQAIGIP